MVYLIGNVTDLGDSWEIRLDRKFHSSRHIRVPK